MRLAVRLAACAVVVLVCRCAVPAIEIPLRCDRGGCGPDAAVPLGCGIPLKDGQANDTHELAIQAAGKGLVPAQFEIRTRYESGSIMWLWADFIAPPGGQYKLVFQQKNPAVTLREIVVCQTDQRIVINNGALELIWNRQYATPIQVSCVAGNAKRQIATGNGDGIYFIDNRGRRAVLGGPNGQLEWRIETAGKLRVVLRGEGDYTVGDGDRVARAVVRYHIFRDRPEVRLEHTFIVTRDNDEVWYKELGISLPLNSQGTNQVLFAEANGNVQAEEVDANQESWIFQREYPVYARNESICELGRGEKSTARIAQGAGWSALESTDGALILSVRDFAQQFPKEFCAGNGRLTAKLWSGRDGRRLDFHQKTLAADWWREWVDSSNAEPYNQKPPQNQPENMRSGKYSPSCVGVARTHTLQFAYFPAPPGRGRYRELDAGFQMPPAAYPDPRWTCHVDRRAFWQLAAKGEGGKRFEDIEAFISFWFDQFMMPQECFRQTGFYDWGWNPVLSYFKTCEDDRVRIYGKWMRLNFSNIYALSKFLLIGWARSGDRRYLDAATRFTRYTSDYKFIHADGGRDGKQKGQIAWGFNHCLPTWWGKGTLSYGIDGDIVSPLALLYLLQDERWAKDTLRLYHEQMMKFEITRLNDGGHPNVPLNHLMGVYRVFPSTALRAKIAALFEGFTDPAGPGGMSPAWFAPGDGRHKDDYALYKINMKALSVMEYCDLFGYEGRNLKILERAARAASIEGTFDATKAPEGLTRQWREEKVREGVIGPEIVSACTYQDYYGATAAQAYKYTNKPEFRAVASGQLEAIRRFWTDYQKLPREKTITAVFKSASGTPRTAVYNAYSKSSADRHPYYFQAPTAGTAFLVLPTVIWMLDDFKQPEWP